jgi:hypothetical protein
MKAVSLLLWCLLFAVNTGQSQTVSNNVVIGTIDSIYSKVLKEKRAIWVSVPNTAEDGEAKDHEMKRSAANLSRSALVFSSRDATNA